ncbi:MAG: TadE/TadG family type IV pilus assembly protein [Rhodocyclaceae bacterium]|nr:TadE/TadG family type IV pilus assembly protein [Rhodocyclaceae bacterium]
MKKPIHQRGVAAVEFAILLPVLLLIVFGITEFGRALYSYNTLVKSVRDAARYAMIHQPGGGADPETKCLAVYGNTGCTGTALAPGLTIAMVSVCDWQRCPGTHQAQGSAPVVNLVTVTISGYAFQSFVPFVTAGLSSLPFAPISTTMKGNL